MAVSKAKSASNARWDMKNTHVFSVKVRKDEAEKFKAACEAEALTPYAVLLRAVRATIAAHEKPPAPETANPTETREPDSDADG